MKTILLSLSFLILISCSSTYQTARPNNINQIVVIDKIHTANYALKMHDVNSKMPCHYGKCLCDKRLLELQDCFEETVPYFDRYAHIK